MAGVSGVIRCLRPFPVQVTWAPVPRKASARVRDELGDAKAGLDGERQQGAVAAAGSRGGVRGGEQRGGFGLGEVGDELALEPLGRDGSDPLDDGRALEVAQGREAEQCVDRGQPGVAGADAVAALVLQVVEERADQRGAEVGDLQLEGCFPVWCAAQDRSSLSESRWAATVCGLARRWRVR